jgi:hypothetical protein
MKKLSFLFALAFFCALPAFAQKGTKFTFSKTETADDFPLKGKSITVEGQLVATDIGSSVVEYEIRYYVQKRANDVMLTKVQLQSPVFEKSKTKTPVTISYFYFTKEVTPHITFAPDSKEGYYMIEATMINANGESTGISGIQAEVISVSKAEKERWGYDESMAGFRQIQVGKFKSATDFEKFKKMLLQ